MSEYQPDKDESSQDEQEPKFGINLGDTHFEMTRRNTYLYTFMGKMALYDHVFLKRDDIPRNADGNQLGTYLFKEALRKELWERLESTLLENKYPAYLNHEEPSESDKASFMLTVLKDIDDIPDWMPEA